MDQATSYWDRIVAQRISRRRALQMAAIGGASAGAIAVVGCSSSKSGTTTPAAGTTPGGGTNAKPFLGGTLRSALSDTQSKFDAQKFPTFTVQTINSFSYSRLLKSASGPQDPNKQDLGLANADWYRPVPDLASKVETVDPTTFIFTLQPGAKWQNVPPLNGRAVTADDIVQAFAYYRSARPDKGNNLVAVDTLTASGTNQVQVKLKQPFGPFLIIMSSPS
ncbi:MAG: ABC transporter substrate-binding protein, partial [Dehalococcoidia bacterium]